MLGTGDPRIRALPTESPSRDLAGASRSTFAIPLEIGANVGLLETQTLANADWCELTAANQSVHRWTRDSEELADFVDRKQRGKNVLPSCQTVRRHGNQ
jgi:hypothetical protein